jgi:hypothetical protein
VGGGGEARQVCQQNEKRGQGRKVCMWVPRHKVQVPEDKGGGGEEGDRERRGQRTTGVAAHSQIRGWRQVYMCAGVVDGQQSQTRGQTGVHVGAGAVLWPWFEI